ncbi:MAG: FAD-dependent monooxygenase [Burkholderiales bacterium]|nr:FAD-dependent monooxygenase [Burkholderiales bacterium]PZN01409.1 MAG: hypothetical protein DIU74_10120 [Pseudomonadota bacterium]
MDAEAFHCDVLITGGGPVGAALALALRGCGLEVRLVEPQERRIDGLRPIALSHGSRLILERLGATALKTATPISTVHVSQSGGFGRTLITQADMQVPALGYVIDLSVLAADLKARVAPEHVVGRVVRRETDRHAAVVTLDNGTRLRARLLVLADGGQSMGDEWALRDYGQSAIVGLVRCEAAQTGTAWERFTPDGPLALLPFDDRYALVWTVKRTDAPALLALDESSFLRRLESHFGSRLGRFVEVSDRASVPLLLRYRTNPIAAARTIVVGNAAQTLHPVAGQGLNLGLRDAMDLAKLLRATPRERLGEAEMLAAYRTRRGLDRHATIGLTDTLIRVFSNDDGALRWARGAALAALDLIPPARRFFARRMIYGARALP